MPAEIINLRNAIAADLTAEAADGTFSLPFTTVSKMRPEFKVADLKDLKVTCIASDDRAERDSRRLFKHDYTISLLLQQHVGSDEESRSEALLLLAQELSDYYADHASPYAGADFVGTDFVPLFNRQHLTKYNVLTIVVELIFCGWRPN